MILKYTKCMHISINISICSIMGWLINIINLKAIERDYMFWKCIYTLLLNNTTFQNSPDKRVGNRAYK